MAALELSFFVSKAVNPYNHLVHNYSKFVNKYNTI